MLREILQEISYSGATNPFDINLKKHLELCVRNTQTNTVIYVDPRSSSKSKPDNQSTREDPEKNHIESIFETIM